jgi:5S rRNA maturation endonuclease (ribonuclease M5)
MGNFEGMKIYSWDEIKARGDCLSYARDVLGLTIKNERCQAVWRGGDGFNVSLEKDKWYDHGPEQKGGKVGGSIIDLCAIARHASDLFAAQEELGNLYGLTSRQDVHTKRKFVCAYDYTDADGKLVFQVVRWEPKDFTQRRPDPDKPGEFVYNMNGIERVLYKLPDVIKSPWVCIVGGEKDADNLRAAGIPATCNAGGEGNWQSNYNSYLAGKFVCIIADKDDAGRNHADIVSHALRDQAKQIKILELPDRAGQSVKDASDWLAAGGTKAELLAIIAATPELTKEALAEVPAVTQEQVSAAKKANAIAYCNYTVMRGVDEKNKPVVVKAPRLMNEMVQDCFTRFWNFPRRIGSALFDHDRRTGQIRVIDSPSALGAWIAEKSGHPVMWARNIEGCPTYDQFFSSMLANAPYYNMISGVPNWPLRDDVYYTHGKLPEPDPEANAFKKLIKFFNPSSRVDADLIGVFFASCIYFRQHVDRPLWVIDSMHGQGTGKTKLVEMAALLCGGDDQEQGEPLYLDHNQLNNETMLDRITRRLLSQSGRRKRVCLIDNVEGFFRSPALATMITQSTVSGMAPYAKGEESRPSDMTFVITSNSATMDRDLISRSFFIHLEKPANPVPFWERLVSEYVKKNRPQIIADIVGILDRGPKFDFEPVTRFRTWEREVMAPLMGDFDAYSSAFKANAERKESSDSSAEEGENVRAIIMQELAAVGIKADELPAWIPSKILTEWASKAIPGLGGRTGRGAIHAVRNMVKSGLIPELSMAIEKYPHAGALRSRGMMWNMDAYNNNIAPYIVYRDQNDRVCAERYHEDSI